MIRREEPESKESGDDASEGDAKREEQPTPAKPERAEAGELSEDVDEICGAVAKVGEDSEYDDEQEAVERKCRS
jgi:hypothetical protein